MQEDEMLKIKRKKKKEIDFKLHSKYHSLYVHLVNFQTFSKTLSRKSFHKNYKFLLINQILSLFSPLLLDPNITFTRSLKFPG